MKGKCEWCGTKEELVKIKTLEGFVIEEWNVCENCKASYKYEIGEAEIK